MLSFLKLSVSTQTEPKRFLFAACVLAAPFHVAVLLAGNIMSYTLIQSFRVYSGMWC